MRSQNTKCKSSSLRKVSSGKVGGTSCFLLLLLTFLAINPTSCLPAFAEETLEAENETSRTSDDVFNEASAPAPQSEIPSTIGISFSPSAGSASLSPTTSAGQSAQIKVLATVNIQKSGGYSIYVKSNSQNLVGVNNNSNVIPGMQGSSTYDNIPVNTWGYYATEGNVVPDNASYKAVSTTGNGDKIAENTSNKITNDTKTIALSFATKINDEKPADTYQNIVTMSVVSSPWAIAEDFGIGNMQEMTSTICTNAKDNDGDGVISGQLKDTRDGKYYWVSKLADGKCWMTQNLDLDLSTKVALTPESSDVKANWTPGFDTATVADEDTILVDDTGTRSWSLGDVRVVNPNEPDDCGYPKNDALQCPEQFVAYATPTSANGDELAHYILGNHYQWNAVTAGTGRTITSGQAESSICPKGWRLPTSGSGGEFEQLVAALGGAGSTNNVTKAPFYGARGGFIDQDTDYLFIHAGYTGRYRSSMPYSIDTLILDFAFYGVDNVSPSNSGYRYLGISVRCIAR